MKTVLKTINPATLNFAEAILKDAEIPAFVMDQNMSLMDGSIGVIPRRLSVIDEDLTEAIAALEAAGLGNEVYRDD